MASTISHHEKSHHKEYEGEVNYSTPGLRSGDAIHKSRSGTVDEETAVLLKDTGFISLSRASRIHAKDSSIRNSYENEDESYEDGDMHQKNSHENQASNPVALTDDWVGGTSTVQTSSPPTTVEVVRSTTPNEVEEVSRVNPAPTDYSVQTDHFENTIGESPAEYVADEPSGDDSVDEVYENSPSESVADEPSGDDSVDEVHENSPSESVADEPSGDDSVDEVYENSPSEYVADEPSGDDSVNDVYENFAPCQTPTSGENKGSPISFGIYSPKNPGIVLRYQYELVQDLTGIDWTINSKGERDGTDYLIERVLPSVEDQIVRQILLPVLFEDCGADHGMRRRLNDVVGIDAKPDDIPLPQTECTSTYIPQDPLLSFQCHRIEGALTLYFPPNFSYAAALPSVSLRLLKAIEESMEDGSFVSHQESILSSMFLDRSYSFPLEEKDMQPQFSEHPSSGGKGGLISGLVVMFIVLILAGGYLSWRRHKSPDRLGSEDDTEDSSVVDDGHDTVVRSKAVSINVEEDGDDASTASGASSNEEGYATESDQDGDGESSYSSDSDDVYEEDDEFDQNGRMLKSGYGGVYTRNARQKKASVNKSIVMGGMSDEVSVATGATGATGLHSEASQRTVKMKNIVLPNVWDEISFSLASQH